MPKASKEAREARRKADERLASAYGWPDRRTRYTVDWRVGVVLVLVLGILAVLLSGWHL